MTVLNASFDMSPFQDTVPTLYALRAYQTLLALLYNRTGWPAHGDGYCNVGRRRSWTWIKLDGARNGVPRKHSFRQHLSSASA